MSCPFITETMLGLLVLPLTNARIATIQKKKRWQHAYLLLDELCSVLSHALRNMSLVSTQYCKKVCSGLNALVDDSGACRVLGFHAGAT